MPNLKVWWIYNLWITYVIDNLCLHVCQNSIIYSPMLTNLGLNWDRVECPRCFLQVRLTPLAPVTLPDILLDILVHSRPVVFGNYCTVEYKMCMLSSYLLTKLAHTYPGVHLHELSEWFFFFPLWTPQLGVESGLLISLVLWFLFSFLIAHVASTIALC